MKRPYPFSLDNPPAPSFNYKFPTLVGPIRSDESASCGNGGTFNFEASDTILRLASFLRYCPLHIFIYKYNVTLCS